MNDTNYIKTKEINQRITELLSMLELHEKIICINSIRETIHSFSPFKNEPVDFVRWVKNDMVYANDYNPNKVAPPEMELLEISIHNDGYTQPIVGWLNDDKYEVVDGFHRNRVGKESKVVNQRVLGYLPIVNIRSEQSDKNDRIASTIRHNRARGKHQVNAMSEIVIELKNRNWTNARISKQLGMDEEEVLRLCQISGLEHLFTDRDFSKSWESSDYVDEYAMLSDDVSELDMDKCKIPNEKDETRIFHTFDKWECHKAGFYASCIEGVKGNDCVKMYADFLRDEKEFRLALSGVITNWKNSCEHYLTNKSMNRIAWLGQAAACYSKKLPATYCSGFNLLTDEEKELANNIALEYLNEWLFFNGRAQLTIEEGLSIGRQTELY
jgi:ParB-like chromosome segregation protein Spo0J